MGVKIEKAIYTKTKEEITHIEADKQELNKEKFTCVYCGKELKFRVSGKRRLEGRTIDISPYFYLVKGRQHGENCKYNTFGQLEIIARKPMTLKDFMKKKKPNQYAIRLQVIKDAMAEAPVEEEENINSKPKDKKDTPEIEYKNVGTMAPYLSRMKDIMILRSRMEKNNDIKNHLKVEFIPTNCIVIIF